MTESKDDHPTKIHEDTLMAFRAVEESLKRIRNTVRQKLDESPAESRFESLRTRYFHKQTTNRDGR
jgi:vacuolar-type H+-ATPase subunit E/Vma4